MEDSGRPINSDIQLNGLVLVVDEILGFKAVTVVVIGAGLLETFKQRVLVITTWRTNE